MRPRHSCGRSPGCGHRGEGRIARPAGDGVVFLPERPYLPPGTLRDLLAIHGAARVPDDRIRAALRAIGVDCVLERAGGLDVELDRDALSLDEQRLVAAARVLLAAPCFALIAGLEAGVGASRAADVLATLAARGIGYVVFGDEGLGREHFDAVLDIAADGTWTCSTRWEVA